MDEDKGEDEPDEEAKAEEEVKSDDGVDQKRKADGAQEPPAFGVEGDGGDGSVLEAAKQEVTFVCLVFDWKSYTCSPI